LSDIVLGALIGAGATALGSIIIGIINYRNSKLRINVRRDEARIDRLIRVRENVLIPLREALSKWLEVSKQSEQKLAQFEIASKKKADTPSLAEIMKDLAESWDKGTQISIELAILQGQLSDSTLNQLIEDAKTAFNAAGPQIRQITRFANDPQNLGTELLKNTLAKYDSLTNNLRGYLLTANKRIEELLAGEPSN